MREQPLKAYPDSGNARNEKRKGRGMSLAYQAMMFAREAHSGQVRKYTGNPYTDHLAEVAGIVVAAESYDPSYDGEGIMPAVAWLHDCIEDCGIEPSQIGSLFGWHVRRGVEFLSDMETGTRKERKAAGRARLATAPGWVQTIKCADLISNTASIVKHDPKFAVTYLEEKRLLLEVLTKADQRLLELARTGTASAS